MDTESSVMETACLMFGAGSVKQVCWPLEMLSCRWIKVVSKAIVPATSQLHPMVLYSDS